MVVGRCQIKEIGVVENKYLPVNLITQLGTNEGQRLCIYSDPTNWCQTALCWKAMFVICYSGGLYADTHSSYTVGVTEFALLTQ